MAAALYVGTSGFAYEEWRGPFYPPQIRTTAMLRYYAGRFGSVELNYTFRREPSERAVRSWDEATPGGFVFAVKAPQRITHRLRLADAGEAATSFLSRMAGLGAKLGPILIQCPPNLGFDPGLIDSLLGELPRGRRYAFEFRNPSWAEARPRIEAEGAAWCVSDTEEEPVRTPSLPPGSFAYLRLRRDGYTDEALRRWAAAIAAEIDGRDVFCYLKHEEQGRGPTLAARLRELVAEEAAAVTTPPGRERSPTGRPPSGPPP